MMVDKEKDELLRDYIAGALTHAQASELERRFISEPALKQEAALMLAVRNAMAEQIEPVDQTDGWQRLQTEIDRQTSNATIADHQPANDNRVATWWRWAAVGLAFVCAGQFLLATGPALISGQDTERYYAVTEAPPKTNLIVTFNPDGQEEAIRRLLQDTEGQIVSGPSSIGVYEVHFGDVEDRDAALKIFLQRQDVIDTAHQ
ncbi:MAG: hypothetical protein AAF742_00150 [Pseudomonadota bacterium]